MGEETRFRRARVEDCGEIAALYSISSDGVADYIWRKLAGPGEDPLEVGERRYAREDTVFSYKNCVVAEHNGEVIGMLVAFPMEAESDPGEPEEDPVLAPYGELERPGSYYVCGMALFPEHRRRGLGARMLGLAREEARRRGLAEMSLIVFERNAGAKRLYERHGFREVARRPVVPHQLIRYTGDALLMVAEVA
jgi:ribosomal protein S18 acetylase RimI-like enzyme